MVSLHYSTHIVCRLACCLRCVQHFFILCRQILCLFLKVRDCMRRKPTSYGVWRFHVNLVFFLRATFQELRKGKDYKAVPMRWYCEHNTAYACSHTFHIFQHTQQDSCTRLSVELTDVQLLQPYDIIWRLSKFGDCFVGTVRVSVIHCHLKYFLFAHHQTHRKLNWN
jgi:hypothetical protein